MTELGSITLVELCCCQVFSRVMYLIRKNKESFLRFTNNCIDESWQDSYSGDYHITTPVEVVSALLGILK